MKHPDENSAKRSQASELARQAAVTQALILLVALVILVSLMFGDTSQVSRALADLRHIRTLLQDDAFPEILPNYIRAALRQQENPYPVDRSAITTGPRMSKAIGSFKMGNVEFRMEVQSDQSLPLAFATSSPRNVQILEPGEGPLPLPGKGPSLKSYEWFATRSPTPRTLAEFEEYWNNVALLLVTPSVSESLRGAKGVKAILQVTELTGPGNPAAQKVLEASADFDANPKYELPKLGAPVTPQVTIRSSGVHLRADGQGVLLSGIVTYGLLDQGRSLLSAQLYVPIKPVAVRGRKPFVERLPGTSDGTFSEEFPELYTVTNHSAPLPVDNLIDVLRDEIARGGDKIELLTFKIPFGALGLAGTLFLIGIQLRLVWLVKLAMKYDARLLRVSPLWEVTYSKDWLALILGMGSAVVAPLLAVVLVGWWEYWHGVGPLTRYGSMGLALSSSLTTCLVGMSYYRLWSR